MVPTGPGKFVQVIQKTSPNVTTFVLCHPEWRGVVSYDSFAERVSLTRTPSWCEEDAPGIVDPTRTWSETDGLRLVAWLARRERFNVKLGTALEGLSVAAESNPFHPVRSYLESCRWDAKDRASTWLSDYCRVADSPYVREVGRRWLISAVARVMRPGCQVDNMLVFESVRTHAASGQGMGKSRAFRALVPDSRWHSETGIVIGDKDSYQCLHGVWIYVFDELGSMRKSERAKVKNFITSPKDHYRPSFARTARDFPRQTVFGGTIDEAEYLNDPAGDRRYWPVRIGGEIDVASIVRDRDQLWAQALAQFESGMPWHVDNSELKTLCESEQSERRQADEWEPIVAKWLEHPKDAAGYPFDISPHGISTTEALIHAVGKLPADIRPGDGMKMANVLVSLGYERGPRRVERGAKVRRYSPPR